MQLINVICGSNQSQCQLVGVTDKRLALLRHNSPEPITLESGEFEEIPSKVDWGRTFRVASNSTYAKRLTGPYIDPYFIEGKGRLFDDLHLNGFDSSLNPASRRRKSNGKKAKKNASRKGHQPYTFRKAFR